MQIRHSSCCSYTPALVDFPLISTEPLRRSDGIKKSPCRLRRRCHKYRRLVSVRSPRATAAAIVSSFYWRTALAWGISIKRGSVAINSRSSSALRGKWRYKVRNIEYGGFFFCYPACDKNKLPPVWEKSWQLDALQWRCHVWEELRSRIQCNTTSGRTVAKKLLW